MSKRNTKTKPPPVRKRRQEGRKRETEGKTHHVDLRAWSHLLPHLLNGGEDPCLTLNNTKLLSVDVWREIALLPDPQLTAMLPFLTEYSRGTDFKPFRENENTKNLIFSVLERLASLPKRHPACENFIVSSLCYNKSNRHIDIRAISYF